MATKMLNELSRRMDEHMRTTKYKKIQNIKKNQSVLNNTVNEIKNILKEIKGILEAPEEYNSNLENRVVKINKAEKEEKIYIYILKI